MTEGSETWELDSKGKVVDICGTREVLFFNFAYKYNYKVGDETCNMYGFQANLYNANIPDKNNRFNTWNFEDITLTGNDFLSVDKNELAAERGEDGSLPEVNFMKLNPDGPNYAALKTIEDEMKNYEILEDGTIRNIITNQNVTNIENGEESDSSEEDTDNSQTENTENENNENNENINESDNGGDYNQKSQFIDDVSDSQSEKIEKSSNKEISEIIESDNDEKTNIMENQNKNKFINSTLNKNDNNNDFNTKEEQENNDNDQNNDSALSTGAIVGIILGIIFLQVLLFL